MKRNIFTKQFGVFIAVLLCLLQGVGQAQIINTVVGGASGGVLYGDGGQDTAAQLKGPTTIIFDKVGNMYIAEYTGNVVRKVTPSGIISTVAGNYVPSTGYGGDNGPATAAKLYEPAGLALDTSGNLYISETGNNRIRKVDAVTGIITTVVGTGKAGYNGDGIAADTAQLKSPFRIIFDKFNNLYIADGNNRIRKVDAVSGLISTVAGNGIAGYNGDGIPAANAQLKVVASMIFDTAGNMYIADYGNFRVRKVDAVTRLISTVAGNGVLAFNGDNIAATAAGIGYARNIALDPAGNLYIADGNTDSRIRKVDMVSGMISTIAGTGTSGYNGDNIAATTAQLRTPWDIVIDAAGNKYIADEGNNRIRKIDAVSGIISTVVGMTGNFQYISEGKSVTKAYLATPTAVAFDATGNIYIADPGQNRIWKADAISGIISTAVGTGTPGYSGDGGAATAAQLGINSDGGDLTFDAAGNLYIVDNGNSRIRKVDASGTITTIAGTGTAGYNGDGILAINAQLNFPIGIDVDATGNIYIADAYNYRIRKIDGSGMISTVAGTGTAGYTGDMGPATAAQIGFSSISVDAMGNLYIPDRNQFYIRKVNTSGIISTIAGIGALPPTYFAGDGGPATSAALPGPRDVAIDAAGNVYIADYMNDLQDNDRIRKIDLSGIINTIAGKSTAAFSGDGGIDTAAELNAPSGVTFDRSGSLFIVDQANHRIREIIMACNGVTAGAIANMGNDTFCASGSTTLNLLGATANGYNFFAMNSGSKNGISYQWQAFTSETGWRNTGTDTTTYATGTITATTAYRVITTCTASGLSDTTAVDTLVVQQALTPSVSIAANTGINICPATNVVFTATPTNGGINPTYQWTKNGIVINGNNSNTYTDNGLNNNDSIVCTLTTGTGVCVNTTMATSNTLKMSVTGAVNPSVSISADNGTNICAGAPVTFTASPTGGGANPAYQWIKNGAVVNGVTGGTYTDNNITNNDSVRSILTSSATCAIPTTANSNMLTMTVIPTVTPTIGISANPGNTACSGIPVNFTTTVGNAGTSPIYQWTINGTASGSGATYTSSSLNSNDIVACTLISSATCASPDTVKSSAITMTINQSVTPGVSISATNTNISAGTVVVFTATATNGGSNTTYQWQVNGINVPGATTSTYVTDSLADANSVTCIVHSNAICAIPDSATSNAVVIHVSTGVHSISSTLENLTLSPNPNKGTFTISGTINDSKEISIEVLNVVGQVVYQDKVVIGHNQLQKQVSLPAANANGVYLLRLRTDNGTSVKRFVIER